jgi:hypothetical protein
MTGISQNGIKSSFFAISGRNSGERQAGFEYDFEKTKPIDCRSAFCVRRTASGIGKGI